MMADVSMPVEPSIRSVMLVSEFFVPSSLANWRKPKIFSDGLSSPAFIHWEKAAITVSFGSFLDDITAAAAQTAMTATAIIAKRMVFFFLPPPSCSGVSGSFTVTDSPQFGQVRS